MDITGLIIQLVAGAAGGNIAGAAMKDYSLGTPGNSIAGVLGGGIGGETVGSLVAAAAGGLFADVAGGAIGGAVLMILSGLVKKMTAK